jgi:hypothetical protein
MTALGAKPNHGFFNCQHPAPGNPRARIPARCRAVPSSHAAAFARARMRCAQASVPSKQNIFFSAVSCFTRETSADAVRHRGRERRHPGAHRQAMNGSLNFFVRHGRFSAPHNPDCAKLRSLVGAVDSRRHTSEPPSTHRADGIARLRAMRPTRVIAAVAVAASDHGRMRRRPTNGMSHAVHPATGIRKRRSRPRFRGRLPDAPGIGAMSRCDQ